METAGLSSDHYIDGNLRVGRIELCFNGNWNPVCQDFWSEAETAVACYQMGFSRYGKLHTCIFLFTLMVVCVC